MPCFMLRATRLKQQYLNVWVSYLTRVGYLPTALSPRRTSLNWQIFPAVVPFPLPGCAFLLEDILFVCVKGCVCVCVCARDDGMAPTNNNRIYSRMSNDKSSIHTSRHDSTSLKPSDSNGSCFLLSPFTVCYSYYVWRRFPIIRFASKNKNASCGNVGAIDFLSTR